MHLTVRFASLEGRWGLQRLCLALSTSGFGPPKRSLGGDTERAGSPISAARPRGSVSQCTLFSRTPFTQSYHGNPPPGVPLPVCRVRTQMVPTVSHPLRKRRARNEAAQTLSCPVVRRRKHRTHGPTACRVPAKLRGRTRLGKRSWLPQTCRGRHGRRYRGCRGTLCATGICAFWKQLGRGRCAALQTI